MAGRLDKATISKLILQCKKGDSNAQRKIYDAYVGQLYNASFRILKSKMDVEDALQNSFIKIFQNIHKYDALKGAFFSWAYRISINESLQIARKKITIDDLDNDFQIPDSVPIEISNLETDYIYACLDQLNDIQRIVFNLYEIEGYSHAEIGEKLDISTSYSRTYLTRAKAKLRSILNSKKIKERVG